MKFSVTTSSGTYSVSVDVATELPWVVNTGVKTVPVMCRCCCMRKDAAGYNWEITRNPAVPPLR